MEMWKVSDCVTCEWFWTPRNVNTGPRLNGDPWSTCLPPPNWDTSHGKCFQLLENSGWENINSNWRLPVVNNLSSLSFEVAWLTLLRARTFPQCRRERVPFKGTHDILQSIWYGGRCHDSLEEGQYWSCIKIFRAALNARHFRRLFASSRLLVRRTMRWRKGWNR